MSRAALISSVLFAAVALQAQDISKKSRGIRFPPDLEAPTITVIGVGGNSIRLTAADLAQLPQQKVQAIDHGTAVTFQGVLLTDLLAKVDTPSAEKYRGTAASYYVLVQAADGYRAVFSWAEIDPTFSDRKVYVVTKRDGTLLGNDGPFFTVVPDDKRQSRWVKRVVGIVIKQAGGEGLGSNTVPN